jgi:hypothetical protein
MKDDKLSWKNRIAARALRLGVEGIHVLRCSLKRITHFAVSAFTRTRS